MILSSEVEGEGGSIGVGGTSVLKRQAGCVRIRFAESETRSCWTPLLSRCLLGDADFVLGGFVQFENQAVEIIYESGRCQVCGERARFVVADAVEDKTLQFCEEHGAEYREREGVPEWPGEESEKTK